MIFKQSFQSVSAAVEYLNDLKFPYTEELNAIMLLETKGCNDRSVVIEMQTEMVEGVLPSTIKTAEFTWIKYRHTTNWDEAESRALEFTTDSAGLPMVGWSWNGRDCFSVIALSDIPVNSTVFKDSLIKLNERIQSRLEGPFSSEDPISPVLAHTAYDSNAFVSKFKTFKLGDLVTKKSGSRWTGKVVGFYSTELTPEGYAVESLTEVGSVQIYPVHALIEKAF